MSKIRIITIILLVTSVNSYSHVASILNNTSNLIFTVIVTDSASQEPIQSARVSLFKNESNIETELTNVTGMANFKDVSIGRYIIKVFSTGYSNFIDTLNIDETSLHYFVRLKELSFQTEEIEILGEREQSVTSVDSKTGNQIFEASQYHAPPESGMAQVIQENLAGAVKAPSGEVHINGEHGEFSYYVDGIPIPLGVFGGLNEVVDSKVIDRATFITDGYPAEYGGQMTGVIDITNRVPIGKIHLDFSSYFGSYFVLNGTKPFSPGKEFSTGQSTTAAGDTLGGRVGPFRTINSNGQSISLSNHYNKFSFFVSGSRQITDRRIDQPVVTLFNDRGTDYFLYGKFDYQLNKTDYLTANLNYGRTKTQVPFDSAAQGYSPDNQVTTNSFQSLSYFHTISERKNKESNLFIGAYAREGTLLYTPSSVSPVSFQFQGDSTLYSLTEDRSFSTYGVRAKYDTRLTKTLGAYFGIDLFETLGKENFTSRDSVGNPGPSVTTNPKGSDFGVFTQGDWHPVKPVRFEFGVRYDQHISPYVKLQKQYSPRLKLNLYADDFNSLYLYYGKLFIPTNIEGLRNIASNVSTSQIPTIPERSDFYEIAYIRNFKFGLKSKIDFFYKYSSPGLDDQTVGTSAIKTPVNIEIVKTTGIKLALSYTHPKIPISAYLNAALIHAYGQGAVTGGFLDIDKDGNGTDLDHDQRLSITLGLNYQPKKWFINLTSTYGSGLTNGNPNDVPFKTGLFDFNSDAHVSPYIIFNIGGGYTFNLKKKATLEPSIFISNILDNSYILKGAYFSSASYGERRNVTLKLALHI